MRSWPAIGLCGGSGEYHGLVMITWLYLRLYSTTCVTLCRSLSGTKDRQEDNIVFYGRHNTQQQVSFDDSSEGFISLQKIFFTLTPVHLLAWDLQNLPPNPFWRALSVSTNSCIIRNIYKGEIKTEDK
jgi:hypothetical protein